MLGFTQRGVHAAAWNGVVDAESDYVTDLRPEPAAASPTWTNTETSASLSDQVTAVNLLGRRMDSVLLIQTLGGGWDRSILPEHPECCGKTAGELQMIFSCLSETWTIDSETTVNETRRHHFSFRQKVCFACS